MIKVLGIKIIDRIKEAGLTQNVLSKHSPVITTRLGFHEVTDAVCSREAVMILHLNGDPVESGKLTAGLREIGGIEVREIEFSDGEQETPDTEGDLAAVCLMVERDAVTIAQVQQMLTAFGCSIRTRLGVNESFFGEPAGLIVLELTGDNGQRRLLINDLRGLKKVHVRVLSF